MKNNSCSDFRILIDASAAQSQVISQHLTQSLSPYGFETILTADRLSRFHRVENTYISIFMALGSLGLILGSFGLGLVVLLNVLDRAGELAMMRAVGFTKKALVRLLFFEHSGLLAAGLIMGIVSAMVAAGPRLAESGQFPWQFLMILAGILLCSGSGWIGFSAKVAFRTDLLEPLRKE